MRIISIDSNEAQGKNKATNRAALYLILAPLALILAIPLAWLAILAAPMFLIGAGVGVLAYTILYPLFQGYIAGKKSLKVSSDVDSISKKLLVVDDDLFFAEGLAKTLKKKTKREVDIATNPIDAIDKILDGHYDLIIMDQKMPELTGSELVGHLEDSANTRTLRGHNSVSPSPVLFCSSLDCNSFSDTNKTFFPIIGALQKTNFKALAFDIEKYMKNQGDEGSLTPMSE